MASFDVVSEVDNHELSNAVDQANREIGNRFDFKGIDAKYELKESAVELRADADFQLRQMLDILRLKMTSRSIDIACLKAEAPVQAGNRATQIVAVRQGIETELARKMVKRIKESKMKLQAAIQGNQVRVSGKKRDDLQKAITLLKEAEYDLPLQFQNFRD